MILNQYDPKAIEERWKQFWDEKGYFHSEPNPGKRPYSIVIPPPNVTGALHLGHALNGTLQDVMIRLKRMQGFETLWMPGADHAGIATQAVVERRLFEEEEKTRHDIGRDDLVRRIWAWKDEHEDRIIRQLKAMGSSCDWQRWRFTLDDRCARAVRTAFFSLFKGGFIFRGKRLVNWDVQLQTAVADDEVYHEDIEGRLWHFRYPIEGTNEFVEIATTRPETMLGDTAVAVHPKDERYNHLIGKFVRLPLMDRLIPIIGDGQLVDPTFGTGVVKVTPAHDPNDYACGLRNRLEMISILTPDGRINANGGKYAGLKIAEARKQVVADLEAQGLVMKVEPHRHAVGHSDRSKTPIEPYLSDQWFIKMEELAERAMAAVREGRVRIHPPRYADTYLRWLGEKRDWCISRQLWWGHQIPIWYCDTCSDADLERAFGGRSDVVWRRDPETGRWLVCGLADLAEDAIAGAKLRRDPDVLDTWFSSALWPHSTMGWPEATAEMGYFYPTNLLITAREIITLWVARMVLMSEYNLDQVPFHDVYIHPVIQDGNGMPMKKSLGNGVDPFDIIDKYGADALRYTLVAMTTETQDVRMPVKKERLDDGRQVNVSEKFEIGRNFGTKIFNAARLILMNLEGYTPGTVEPGRLETEDRWLFSRLSKVTRAYTAALESYQFGEAGRLIYDFFWSELCDWYVEIIKPRFRDTEAKATAQRLAAAILDHVIRLLHPVMPFVTEEIWQALGAIAPERGLWSSGSAAPAAAIAPWPQPKPDWENDGIEADFALLQEIIRSVRNIRSQFNVNPKAELEIVLDSGPQLAQFLAFNARIVCLLTKARHISGTSGGTRPPKSAAHVLAGCTVYVPLAEHIDFDAELKKQQKKLADVEQRLRGVESKLANEGFISRAPAEVVEQHRQLKADLEQQRADVAAVIADLS